MEYVHHFSHPGKRELKNNGEREKDIDGMITTTNQTNKQFTYCCIPPAYWVKGTALNGPRTDCWILPTAGPIWLSNCSSPFTQALRVSIREGWAFCTILRASANSSSPLERWSSCNAAFTRVDVLTIYWLLEKRNAWFPKALLSLPTNNTGEMDESKLSQHSLISEEKKELEWVVWRQSIEVPDIITEIIHVGLFLIPIKLANYFVGELPSHFDVIAYWSRREMNRNR